MAIKLNNNENYNSESTFACSRQPLQPFSLHAFERNLSSPRTDKESGIVAPRSLVVRLDERQGILGAARCMHWSVKTLEATGSHTYSSAGLTPTFLSMSFPVPFSKMKCERLMLRNSKTIRRHRFTVTIRVNALLRRNKGAEDLEQFVLRVGKQLVPRRSNKSESGSGEIWRSNEKEKCDVLELFRRGPLVLRGDGVGRQLTQREMSLLSSGKGPCLLTPKTL